ncbi:MAG: TSUP family transporter [Oscillospiraceae bacterium]
MVLRIIQAVILAFGAVQGFLLSKQYVQHREKDVTGKQYAVFWGVGFIANFFDYLGIGSLAPTLAVYKLTKTVDDILIPGTLVTGCVVPVAVEALVALSIIEVETLTLFAMYGAGILGAFLGGKVATRLPIKVLRVTMGCGLLIAAALMLMSKFGLMPLGGDALGLHGIKLVIGCVGAFILAALLTVGIGNYAPTMVMVYMLGMNPSVAFPIMMGLGTLGVAGGSFPYFETGRFNKQAAFAFAVAGIPGVLLAAFVVKSMPLSALQWLVIIVAVYTGISMLCQAFSKTKEEQSA